MADDEIRGKVRKMIDVLHDLQHLEAVEKRLKKGELPRAEKSRDEPRLPMAIHGIEAGGHMARRRKIEA